MSSTRELARHADSPAAAPTCHVGSRVLTGSPGDLHAVTVREACPGPAWRLNFGTPEELLALPVPPPEL